MLKPLEEWICDVCGQVIESEEEGYLIWKRNDKSKAGSFKIIHHVKCDLDDHGSSLPLDSVTGSAGLSRLLAFWTTGPLQTRLFDADHDDIADSSELVDLIRRLHVPYYEEARQYFAKEKVLRDNSNANEVAP